MVERLVIMTPGRRDRPRGPPAPAPPAGRAAAGADEASSEKTLKEAREAFERAYILSELRATSGT